MDTPPDPDRDACVHQAANHAARRRAAARRCLALLLAADGRGPGAEISAEVLAVWTRTWLDVRRGECLPGSGLYVTVEDTAPVLR